MKDWKYINGAEVGNASTGDFTNLINRALKVAKEKPEKSSRMNEIVSFLKSAHNLPSDRWQYHVDRLDKEISAAENTKTGNSIYSELNKDNKRVVIESDGSWYVYDKNGKIVEQGRESNSDNAFGKFKAKGYNKKACNQDGVARMFEGLVKDEDKEVKKDSGAIEELETGNSASDDKFAYVMRDFDEGKLKTPDGKVVTNPEQAKAIAYSESKKAENGLSRARMAMKV